MTAESPRPPQPKTANVSPACRRPCWTTARKAVVKRHPRAAADSNDTQNFHKAFTMQKPTDSVANPSVLNDDQQAHFDGFTYVPREGPLSGVDGIADELDAAKLGGSSD